MEIYLDKRAVKQIRVSTADAIEEGDTETLREDILEAFSEAQIEEVDQRLGGSDFYELLSELLEEWSGDDVDELLELIETHLAEVGVDLKYHAPEDDDSSDDSDDDDFEDDDFEDEELEGDDEDFREEEDDS